MSKNNPKIQALKGMNDILPGQADHWMALESALAEWLALYGYKNIRTPILEQTSLFARGIGEVTDVVEKEMYTFTMHSERDEPEYMTMRPEFTAGIVRAAIEHNLVYDRPHRLFATGPVFRHERPQKGRYRQFHQLSVEALGMAGPDIDAEQIIMLSRLWKQLNIPDVALEINSLGQTDERLEHRKALIAYLEQHKDILDEDATRRMYSNPLRVLDTKNPDMQDMANNAPRLLEFLGAESMAHFDELKSRLEESGVPYTVNPRLVRGLDYYNLSVFEWITTSLGAQGTICAGGRYDNLFELLGGKPTPACGFGLGLERLLLMLAQQGDAQPAPECDVYFVHQGAAAARRAAVLAEQCRSAGIRCIVHPGQGSFKSQFKRADNSGARWAAILGEDEMLNNDISLKPLRGDNNDNIQSQQKVAQSELASTLSS